MKGHDVIQKWQEDFSTYFKIYNTFIIDGYIDDLQPYVERLDDEVNDDNPVQPIDIIEYFSRSNEKINDENDKNLLIVYDPTETVSKRFDIRSPFSPDPEEKHDDEDDDEENSPYPRGEFKESLLAQHFYDILNNDDVEKTLIEHDFTGPSPDIAKMHYAITEQNRLNENEQLFPDFLVKLFEKPNEEKNYVFVIKLLDKFKLSEDPTHLNADEMGIFRQLLAISKSIVDTNHKMIILVDRATMLPLWFSDESENYNIKLLNVGKPSDDYKEYFFNNLIESEKLGERFMDEYRHQCVEDPRDDEEDRKQKERARKRLLKKFLAYTNDFSMTQLTYYDSYLDDDSNKVDGIDKLQLSLQRFRVGDIRNPWDDEDKVREVLNIFPRLQEKLKGQDLALMSVQNILRRSTIGLDRIDNPEAPRVVLFLAGPTGTGKTEVCKQIAEIIFGSSERIVRFDMSEYRADESDQKLFGAPPGYVGYEKGGELTNAIIKEPFSLVLFDEIEKAAPSILDKFLQILSDGRLTSGKGETVHFSDSIIVITSNAGVNSDNIQGLTPQQEFERMGMERPRNIVNMKTVSDMEARGASEEEIYNTVSEYLRYYVKYYFVCKLGRPELYGRIEDSIVYYNYIGRSAVEAICKAKIKSFMKAAQDKYFLEFNKDILNSDNPVFRALVRKCSTTRVREMGARGIGKAMNKIFNGSISNFISSYVLDDNVESLRDMEVSCHLSDEYIEREREYDLNKPENDRLIREYNEAYQRYQLQLRQIQEALAHGRSADDMPIPVEPEAPQRMLDLELAEDDIIWS